MKRVLTKQALVLAGLALVAAPAAAGKGPTFGELSPSPMAARPVAAAKPKAIGAKESIAGMKAKTVERAVVVTMESTTGKAPVKASEIGGCIAQGFGAPEWDGPLNAESHNAPTAGVIPIHAERLVEDASGVKLESTEAWLDTRTKGLRLAGKSALALKPVSTIPGGTRIFVGRDEHNGKRFAQFVVAEAKDTPAYMLSQNKTPVARVGATADATRMQQLGVCSHHRIGLAAGSAGEDASFELRVMLPDLGPGETSNASTEVRLPAISEWEKKAGAKDARMRDVRVHFGVSQTSKDKDPILSVTTEWAGEETIERIYTQKEASFDRRSIFSIEDGRNDLSGFGFDSGF